MVKIGKYYTFNSSILGKIKLKLTKKKNIVNCTYIEGLTKGVFVSALLDKNGNEIIPFDIKKLESYFSSEDSKDFCLAYKYPDSEVLEYNHIQLVNDKYKVVLTTSRFDDVPLYILNVRENKNYWVLKAKKDIPEYAVYDYKNQKIITNFFHEVKILEDYERDFHSIYFEKYIFDDDENLYKTKLSSICGFLDSNGDFSSQIYDTNADMLYNSYELGGNTLNPRFTSFLSEMEREYRDIYYDEEERTNDVVSYLFSNPNLSEKIKDYSKNKILEFKPGKKV